MKRVSLALSTALLLASSAPFTFAAEPTPAPAARTIILVRHGAYVPDPKDSEPGPGLSPLGVAQAQLVAARLTGMGRYDLLLGSPLTRANETARVIAASNPTLTLQTIPDLAECTPRTRRKEVLADETPEKIAACESKLNALFAARFVPAAGSERTELFVCHGNVIRYLVTKALGVDTEAWLEMSVPHASITKIRVEPDGRFKVISIGDIGHVPPNMQTGSTGMPERSLAVPK